MSGAVEQVSPAGRPRIEFADVHKGFGSGTDVTPVLDGIDLCVYPGEFVSVVGPSGCGKTTLLNLAGGFAIPDRGRVLFDGQPVRGPSPRRSIVFQQYAVFPWLTVARNIEFGLRLRSQKKPARERAATVTHYVELMGLRGFEHAYPKALSGGMKQRVAIARAYAVNPEVLLMDEPFAALDAQTRDFMQEFLLQVQASERKTVLFVTHSVEEAIFLSNRVVVLTGRPARVRETVTVPLGYPRTSETKLRAEFTDLRRRIEGLLRVELPAALTAEAGGGG